MCGRAVNTSNSRSGGSGFKPRPLRCFLRQEKLFHFVSLHQRVYVVVQFYSWFKFYFPLFLGMVMYDNEFETKQNKI